MLALYAMVNHKRRTNRRTIMEAFTNEKWLEDIQGELLLEALQEYLHVWDVLYEVELHEGIPHKHLWRLSNTCEYTTKSAYDALLQGSISFRPYKRIWKSSWAPPKCLFLTQCWLPTIGAGLLIG